MDLKDQIKPITYLKTKTADLVSEVSESGKTVIITQNGEARVVVMGIETYDMWRKALALLKLAAHAESDIGARRTVSQKQALKDAEAAIRTVERDA